ncbi:MAG: hypothetical protein Q9186_005377 [Xanthomendoza sp. 1 TL-2023]
MTEAKSLAQDFSSRLEAFLKPVAKEERGKMTDFAKEQEDRYERVTNGHKFGKTLAHEQQAYDLHKKTDKTECYNKLVEIDNLLKDEQLRNENSKVSWKERIWQITFEAKHYLLFATFHHDKDLRSELAGCESKAKWPGDDYPGLKLPKVAELCREMQDRILLEREKELLHGDLASRTRMFESCLEQDD